MSKKNRVEPAEMVGLGTEDSVDEVAAVDGGLPGMDQVATPETPVDTPEAQETPEPGTDETVTPPDDSTDEVDDGQDAHPTGGLQMLPAEPDHFGLDLGDGPFTVAPIYLKKRWARDACAVGDCIGYVVTREGVDLNLLIDAVRNQVAGEARPAV